jgi:outer membrane protein TolC
MARSQARLALADMLPQVGLQGSYGYMHGLKVGDETVLDGGSFSLTLNLSIPIFHFGGRINKVRAAEAKAEQVELERQHLDEKMQLELSQATDILDEASLEASLAVRSLSQADENLQLSRKQYEVGMESISDLLEAQTLWQQAYAAKIQLFFYLTMNILQYSYRGGDILNNLHVKYY